MIESKQGMSWREVPVVLAVLLACGAPLLIAALIACDLLGCGDDLPTIVVGAAVICSQSWVLERWRTRPRQVFGVTLVALVVALILVIGRMRGAIPAP